MTAAGAAAAAAAAAGCVNLLFDISIITPTMPAFPYGRFAEIDGFENLYRAMVIRIRVAVLQMVIFF